MDTILVSILASIVLRVSISLLKDGWISEERQKRVSVCLTRTCRLSRRTSVIFILITPSPNCSVRIDVDKWLEEAREDAERIRADPVYAEQRKQERELAVIIPQHEAKRKRIMGPDYVERKPRTATTQPRMQPKPAPAAKPAKTFKDENEKPAAAAAPPPHKQQKQQHQPGPTYAEMQAQIQAANLAKPKKQELAQVPKPEPIASQLKLLNPTNPRPAPRPTAASFPCALCPEYSTEGLVRIANPGPKNKNKVLHAHRICVTFTPTTWVAQDPQTGEDLVYGFELIEKERWNLKCGLCTERHGTKVRGILSRTTGITADIVCALYRFNVQNRRSASEASILHVPSRKIQESSLML